MSTVSISGLSEAKERSPLDTGIYTLEVGDDTKGIVKDDGNITLQVQSEVMEGPEQRDESQSEGRKVYDWFQMTNLHLHSDGGNFARAKLNAFLQASGVDFDESAIDVEALAEDLKGCSFIATNKVRKNKLTQELGENWSKHRAE